MPKEKDIEKLWIILWVSIKMKEMLGKEWKRTKMIELKNYKGCYMIVNMNLELQELIMKDFVKCCNKMLIEL